MSNDWTAFQSGQQQKNAALLPTAAWEAEVTTNVASASELVRTIAVNGAQGRAGVEFRPAPWVAKANGALPRAGDRCVVLFDESSKPYVVCWLKQTAPPAAAEPPATAYRKAAQKIKSGVVELVKLDMALEDTEKRFDLVNGYYVVPKTGSYIVVGQVEFTEVFATAIDALIYVSGTETLRGAPYIHGAGNILGASNVVGIIHATAGQHIELRAYVEPEDALSSATGTANRLTVVPFPGSVSGPEGREGAKGAAGSPGAEGAKGSTGPEGTTKMWLEHTFAVKGELSGESTFPGFFVKLKGGEEKNLKAVVTKIESGTSAEVELLKNGVNVTTFTVKTAAEEHALSTSLADKDYVQIKVKAVSGKPTNMSVTLALEVIG